LFIYRRRGLRTWLGGLHKGGYSLHGTIQVRKKLNRQPAKEKKKKEFAAGATET